ncbi:four helix bundle protein [Aliifodinibius sp. S!AR15-10]|uniref:four helix bundle protein n=1 Tax=Aliifodinibius sp. S!AR15-10 TaxID=2950437 RepID=UPI002867984E|nr:four helix bundle protein [Aliifodinibius sp. S!AR15-10]MDR8393508.1 four helix bundle protein [Aliifodinibius sp. S!AR15-10]
MEYKFEKLEVWNLAMKFNDLSYKLADSLPEHEKFNLASQLKRACTSIALNIAEGSTSQSDNEQARFLSYAIRSHVETVACIRLMEARGYLAKHENVKQNFEVIGAELFNKLQAFKRAIN